MVEYQRRAQLEEQAAEAIADVMHARDRSIPASWPRLVRSAVPDSQVGKFLDPYALLPALLQPSSVSTGDRRDLLLLCGVDWSTSAANLTARVEAVRGRRGGRTHEKTVRDDVKYRLRPLLAKLIIDHLEEAIREADPLDILHAPEEWLERVTSFQATGALHAAADLGERILSLADAVPFYRGTIVHAEAAMAVGHARRDQGRLSGLSGAFALYKLAAAIFRESGELARQTYAELLAAVCVEMSGYLSEARVLYQGLADATGASASTKARARLWVGTAATKQDDYGAARGAITGALAEYEALALPAEFRDAHVKLGLLEAHAGNIDAALELLSDVARGSERQGGIAIVKLRLASADVGRLSGDAGSAFAALEAAWQTIEAGGLAHQAHSHNRLFAALTGERVPVRYAELALREYHPLGSLDGL